MKSPLFLFFITFVAIFGWLLFEYDTAVCFLLSACGSAFPEFLFFNEGETSGSLLLMFNVYLIIGGVGVGIASAICPMYIAEIVPVRIRGQLVSWNQFTIIFGMLVVYFVNYVIVEGEPAEWVDSVGWRYMFLSKVVPAGIFCVLMLFVPETPRYLVMSGQSDKAMTLEQIETLFRRKNKLNIIV